MNSPRFLIAILSLMPVVLASAQTAAPKTSQIDSETLKLETYTVTGERTGDLSSITEKTGVPSHLAANSYAVVPRAVLDDQKALSLADATRNVAGATTDFGFNGSSQPLLILRGFQSTSMTQKDAKKYFDLPEDAAGVSLKRFSEQAGLQVIFPSQLASGIRTRSVKGEMSPREALAAMLFDTGLVAVQEEKTGAFTIQKRTAPNARGNSNESGNSTSAHDSRPNEESRPAPKRALGNVQESGALSGRVINIATGKYIANARISVKGTNLSTLSGPDGYYVHDLTD